MILSPWKRLLYLAGLAGMLYFLFPTNTEMVLLNLESDDPIKGKRYLEATLEQNPGDFDLLVLSSELHWAHDQVEPALEDLRRALVIKPRNLRALLLYATYLEWAQHMDKAFDAWERVVERDPKREDVLLKLAGLAAIMDRTDQAGHYSAKWLKSQQKMPRELEANPFFAAVQPQLVKLADSILEGEPSDLDNAVTYELASGFAQARGALADDVQDLSPFATRMLSSLLRAGKITQAVDLAVALDAKGEGFGYRKDIFDMLALAGMSDHADEAMVRMVQTAPGHEQNLVALLNMGAEQGLSQAKTAALERLTAINPREERYRAMLIAQYVDSGNYDRIAELMDRLAWFTGEGLRYVKQVVSAAFVSGDEPFMALVASESDKVNIRDADLLTAKTRLSLALKDFRKAAELTQILKDMPPAESTAALKAILESGKDYDPEAMGQALALALDISPKDVELLRASVTNDAARGRTDTAYAMAKRCLLLTQERQDFERLAAIARETEKPFESMEEVARLGQTLLGADPVTQRLVADLFLEMDKPVEAYAVQRDLALASADAADVARMLELAQYTGRTQDQREALGLAKSIRPDDPGIVRQLAELAMADSDLDMAEVAYQELLRHDPADQDALKRLVDVYSWTNRPAQAEASLKQLIRLDPRNPQLQRQLADIYSWTNKPSQAVEVLEALRAKGTASRQELLRLAEARESAGQGLAALEIVQELLAKSPSDPELLRLGVQYALWHGKPRLAAELSQRQTALPGGEKFLAQTGDCWLGAGEPAKALPWILKARERNPAAPAVKRLLLQAYLGLGKHREVLVLARDLEAQGALSPEETLAVATAYAGLGQWRTVLEKLDPLVQARTLDDEGELILAQALDKTGAKPEAGKLIDRLARKYAGNAPMLVRVGEIALAGARLETAEAIYQQALAAQPQNPVAMRGMATVLSERGSRQKALQMLTAHNTINPNDSDSRMQAGELQASLGNEAKARKEYKKALRLLNQPTGKLN
ncbi:Beta-barrel assembly-enhancing protease [Fundidesulfovibrio magnetotacticus]|uniref:Beta-barrel assembly-enhancing protease n=1 Tax=Fundidesulfovibrio magnetotacticus TaxID=2730080 RepID=A0A6V8LZR6_9BACT|nr:tetratricopeptide repeat protein [Fundidesulfovibrio magnetotacticus]GFK95127.1 Beta-barrel assembly-enhancing protease [Fundidesulfovibrio magnetotacticus]